MPQQIQDPNQLFAHKLGAALTMEKTVLDMLGELEQTATQDELKQQFSHHREETQQQISNIEQAFQALGQQPQAQPCPTIEGLQQESQENIQMVSDNIVDAVLLGGAAETEHHEIAVYEGLITKAEAMGQREIVGLLQQNLEQEQHTLQEVNQASQQLAQELVGASA